MQPWPTFIGLRAGEEIKEASLKVLNLIKSIPQRLFGYDHQKISEYYGISRSLTGYFLAGVNGEHIDGLLARGDFILTANGLKCLEYNINTNLGGMQDPLWKSAYLRTPIIAEFLYRGGVKLNNRNLFATLFDHLIHAALKRFSYAVDEINLALVSPGYADGYRNSSQERYLNAVYKDILRLKSSRMNGQVIFCDFSRLEVSGRYVYYESRRIHSLVEWYHGFMPVDISDVYKNGNILVYNGSIAWLLSNKLNMALLSENEDSDVFTPQERTIIKKYIPWTRRVVDGESSHGGAKIKLRDFVLSHRETLVLKPILGSGGEGIYMGCHTPAGEWEKLVDTALQGNDWKDLHIDREVSEKQWGELIERARRVNSWVVQEYVESLPLLYQAGEDGCAEHRAVWGFFVFGSAFGGGYVRILPGRDHRGVVNSQQGAQKSVIFEVAESD